jgi:hypothetical protein
MSNAARIQVPVSPPTVEEPAPQAPRGPKNWIFLVTQDEELWPLVGTALDGDLTLKQVDSTDELLNTTPTGEAAVVLWDARDCADRTGALAQLQRHSTNFAIVVLDGAANTEAWRMPAQQRQIVSLVGIPLKGMQLSEALASARAELAGRREAPVENPVVPDEVAPARPQWKRATECSAQLRSWRPARSLILFCGHRRRRADPRSRWFPRRRPPAPPQQRRVKRRVRTPKPRQTTKGSTH